MSHRYCLISPCRDEAAYMRRTLDSVVAQSVPPQLWVIVDDGSSDDSHDIMSDYASRHPFIRVVRREDRGDRLVGPGVIDAFYAGFDTIDQSDFEYVCKLDLDLELPPRYFETLMERMEDNPRLGTCSGKPYFLTGSGQLVSEKCGDEASVGMTKFYRMSCFSEIGGFERVIGWDAIDCHRCRMLGWVAESWDDEQLRFIHLRPMGSSYKGIWTGRIRAGFGQYFMGTSPMWMVASGLFRMTRPPRVIGGLGLLLGYGQGMIRRAPRFDDPEFRRHLRQFQRRCLWRGKRYATQRAHADGERIWRARRGDTATPTGEEVAVHA